MPYAAFLLLGEELAGHKQAAPEPLIAMYTLRVSRVRVNERARLTRSATSAA